MQNKGLSLSLAELNNIFPYYLILDKDLNLEFTGTSTKKLFPEVKLNEHFFKQWNVVRPHVTFEYHNDFQNIIGKLCAIQNQAKPDIILKGHFEKISSLEKYIFYGNPAFNSTSQLLENNLTLADFSLNDTTFDLLHVLKTNEIANEELKGLLQKVNEQKKDLALFKQIIDNSSDAIQVALEDGSLYYINQTASERLGINLKEAKNFTVFDFEKYFKDDPERWLEHIELLKKEDFITLEGINLNQKSSTTIPVEVTVKYSKIGNVGLVTAISRDISERKFNEQQLKNQEEKYRNIISNMNLGLLEIDNNDQIVFCNQSFEKMSGYALSDIKTKIASELFASGATSKFLKEKTNQRLRGDSDSYEILVKNKRGEAKWWLVSGAPNVNDEGIVIGSIGIHLDITEQKRLESELEIALVKAEQGSEAKASFLANMSHEIRTPLNGIIGMVRALNEENLNARQASYLNSAGKASEHLLSVINNILDITKIEAGEFQLINHDFSLEKLLDDVYAILKSQAESGNVGLSFYANNIVKVYKGDEIRLRQIIINLVGNAIKFTENGSVNISCNGGKEKNGFQMLEFRIEDTGIGMSDDYLKNIFQKFHQEDLSIKRKFGGSGLGLAITKEIIDLMKGDIEISSKKNVGTEIIIRLTLEIGDLNQLKKQEIELDTTTLANKHILLVEDNEMNRLVANHVLAGSNLQVTEAINGKQAIELLKAEKYDLILMDIQMPVMDGIEATKYIRNELKNQTPIIALSANAFKTEIDACLAIGVNDYVIKPFDRSSLLKIILKHITKPEIDQNKAQETLYNLNQLEDLAQGDDEFLKSMLELFTEMMPKAVQEMETALAHNDIGGINKIAHKIKPTIDNMGMTTIKEEIRFLEKYKTEDNTYPLVEKKVEKVKLTLLSAVHEIKSGL